MYAPHSCDVKAWTSSEKMGKETGALEMCNHRRVGQMPWIGKKTNKEVLSQLELEKRSNEKYKNQAAISIVVISRGIIR